MKSVTACCSFLVPLPVKYAFLLSLSAVLLCSRFPFLFLINLTCLEHEDGEQMSLVALPHAEGQRSGREQQSLDRRLLRQTQNIVS